MDQKLDDKVAELEYRLLRTQRLLILVGAAAMIVACVAAKESEPSIIKAKVFQVLDDKGQIVARFGVLDDVNDKVWPGRPCIEMKQIESRELSRTMIYPGSVSVDSESSGNKPPSPTLKATELSGASLSASKGAASVKARHFFVDRTSSSFSAIASDKGINTETYRSNESDLSKGGSVNISIYDEMKKYPEVKFEKGSLQSKKTTLSLP